LAATLFPDRRVVEQEHSVGGVHQHLRNRFNPLVIASFFVKRAAQALSQKKAT